MKKPRRLIDITEIERYFGKIEVALRWHEGEPVLVLAGGTEGMKPGDRRLYAHSMDPRAPVEAWRWDTDGDKYLIRIYDGTPEYFREARERFAGQDVW